MEFARPSFAGEPPTRLLIREEALGTLQALMSGQADLAFGVALMSNTTSGVAAIGSGP
jgi:hypothetical protein